VSFYEKVTKVKADVIVGQGKGREGVPEPRLPPVTGNEFSQN
jgi:hypothetical protein